MMPRLPLSAGALAVLLALAGCGDKKPAKDVDALDRELVGNGTGDQTDPALSSALEDQIMVDPALTQQKSGGTRPGTAPAQAPIPATAPVPGGPADAGNGLEKAPAPTATNAPPHTTLGELARMQASPKHPSVAACSSHLQYGHAWAQKLPASLPLFPDAQVSEAAGNDANGCTMRVVSFVSGAPVARLVDFYYTHGRRAGFATEHKVSGAEHIVAGDRGEEAFYASFQPQRSGGTEVDLIVNAAK